MSVLQSERVATTDGRFLGVLCLDSPSTLNALSLEMVQALQQALDTWASDDTVVAVLIRGQGEKAFCAGGDVRRLTEHARTGTGDPRAAGDFFAHEYRLDLTLHRYPKPVLVWGSGIVMGGGMGLLMGARFRVVTETSRLAMPEITIGLYPDVGGSYFLSRLPGRLGLFLGLTAVSLNASDACWLGLATHAVAAGAWTDLLAALVQCDWSAQPYEQMATVLHALALPLPEPGPLQTHAEVIETWMAASSLAALDTQWRSAVPESPWMAKAIETYRRGSPTSAALIWRQWHTCANMSLAEVFRIEWVLSTQCARHPDFPEGVRALLIDKDQRPQWKPAVLAEVDDSWIEAHYEMPAAFAHHPLSRSD